MMHYHPYENKWDQFRTEFNAVTFLAINYHLILFTNYVSYETYPRITKSVRNLILINIGVNVLLTVPNLIADCLKKRKLNFKQKKHREAAAAKLESKKEKKKEKSWFSEF